jgi:hypothetical protein
MIRLSPYLCSRMKKLLYIYVPNEFVIGQLVLKLLIKRLAVAMVNKTVANTSIVLIVYGHDYIYIIYYISLKWPLFCPVLSIRLCRSGPKFAQTLIRTMR